MIVKFHGTKEVIQKDTILIYRTENTDTNKNNSHILKNLSGDFLDLFFLLMKNLSHLKRIAIQNTLIS